MHLLPLTSLLNHLLFCLQTRLTWSACPGRPATQAAPAAVPAAAATAIASQTRVNHHISPLLFSIYNTTQRRQSKICSRIHIIQPERRLLFYFFQKLYVLCIYECDNIVFFLNFTRTHTFKIRQWDRSIRYDQFKQIMLLMVVLLLRKSFASVQNWTRSFRFFVSIFYLCYNIVHKTKVYSLAIIKAYCCSYHAQKC